jgi:hypothetical protein
VRCEHQPVTLEGCIRFYHAVSDYYEDAFTYLQGPETYYADPELTLKVMFPLLF